VVPSHAGHHHLGPDSRADGQLLDPVGYRGHGGLHALVHFRREGAEGVLGGLEGRVGRVLGELGLDVVAVAKDVREPCSVLLCALGGLI